MRRQLYIVVLALPACSLIFDGSDLHGTGGNTPDLSALGDGGGGDGGAGGDAGAGDAGKPACNPGNGSVNLMGNTLMTGTSVPYAVDAVDINLDGKLDLISVAKSSSSVAVLLGDGKGGFQHAVGSPFPSCTGPISQVVGDFDGNGKPDLVVGCWDDGVSPAVSKLVYYQGNGTGDLRGPTPITAPGLDRPIAMVAARFITTTKLDVAVVSETSSTVLLVPGDGAGSFGAVKSFAAGTDPTGIAAGRVNADVFSDFVVTSYGDSTLRVFLSQGAAMWTPTTYPNEAGFPYSPLIADFDSDGDNDVVLAQAYTDGYFTLFTNPGTGALPMTPPRYPAGPAPVYTAYGDFDCDGRLDLVMGAYLVNGVFGSDAQVSVIQQKKAGEFSAPAALTKTPWIAGIAIGDIDNDGRPDIVVAQAESAGKLAVLLNKP